MNVPAKVLDKKAVFLDHDLIAADPDKAGTISRLKQAGYLVVGTWNVQGIKDAKTVEAATAEGETWKAELLGMGFDGAYYCPHNDNLMLGKDQRCRCHKGMPKQFLDASTDLSIDLKRSVIVCASMDDMASAIIVYAKSIAIKGSTRMDKQVRHDFLVKNYDAAVTKAQALSKKL